jgi:hypothetical protein
MIQVASLSVAPGRHGDRVWRPAVTATERGARPSRRPIMILLALVYLASRRLHCPANARRRQADARRWQPVATRRTPDGLPVAAATVSLTRHVTSLPP